MFIGDKVDSLGDSIDGKMYAEIIDQVGWIIKVLGGGVIVAHLLSRMREKS